MNLQTESISRESAKVAASAHHAAALIAALGDPSAYDSAGDPLDCGNSGAQCACGHPVRWLFPIIHRETGRTAAVGSTCINHIAAVSPELGARLNAHLEALNARLAAAQAAARRAAADAANAALWKEYSELRDRAISRHRANREDYRRSPHELWFFVESWHCKYRRNSPPEYTRAADLRKWITSAIAAAKTALGIESEAAA